MEYRATVDRTAMPPSGGTVLKFAGVAPRVASSAALSGTVIGRTVVGDRTTIGHGAVLRGDVNGAADGNSSCRRATLIVCASRYQHR